MIYLIAVKTMAGKARLPVTSLHLDKKLKVYSELFMAHWINMIKVWWETSFTLDYNTHNSSSNMALGHDG